MKDLFNHLTTSQLMRYLLIFILGWVIIELLAYFEHIIIIFTFAAILAFLLNYPVQFLKRILPHTLAVGLVFGLTLALFVGLTIPLGITILAQAEQLLSQSPELLESLTEVLDDLQNVLANWNIRANVGAIEDQLQDQIIAGLGVGLSTLQSFLYNLVNLILIAVVAFFMLLDGLPIWELILKLFPPYLREPINTAIKENFLGFFWGRLLLSIFFGISCLIVFALLQVPYSLILAVIAGVFDLIPGIGATLGISLVTLILLPQGLWLGIKVLITCVVLQQVEENLLMPHIMKDSINLNPIIMFFALLVGARIAGLLGVFLAIPVAGVIVRLSQVETPKTDA
ncbi:AI-2E family transporter [Spirulina subsalsa]|uniref:AI-2E family transporter n=1 Tax=Spirulina subsalsa TaxID=54311 RepID=UPI0002E2675E|nr:AI-2E family transporter [Spirulina subsalsa]